MRSGLSKDLSVVLARREASAKSGSNDWPPFPFVCLLCVSLPNQCLMMDPTSHEGKVLKQECH